MTKNQTVSTSVLAIIITLTTGVSSNPCAWLDLEDVVLLNNTHMVLLEYSNTTIPLTSTQHSFCFERSPLLKAAILKKCEKYYYYVDEYQRLDNGSVDMNGTVLEPGTYMFDEEGELWKCVEPVSSGDHQSEDEEDSHFISQESFVRVGKAGSWVSIFALLAHLVVFCLEPTLRNLPGYHLAALSLAFIFGYSFSLIGQIPSVLGAECVASSILQQYFFLAGFFCMNVMAVDIFRTLRLARHMVAQKGESDRRRQFALYMLYAWGAPLLITAPCALLDHLEGVPEWLRPRYGSDDVCWIGNAYPKAMFFYGPSFVLFAANSVLFVGSALTVHRHSFRGEHQGRVTFVLYLRLGLMMGLTWLLGVLAAVVKQRWLWYVFDLFNSLQGLFIFLLFFCSKRVRNRIRDRWGEVMSPSASAATEKQSSNGTSSSDVSKHNSMFAFVRP